MEVKISVITPSYNRAHTLPRVYDSLKNQTFKNFKWMILDDGSTDDTKNLVQKYQKEAWFPVEYYYNDNQHKFLTVLEGIKKVKSKYHMIVDSDDSYPPNALQILFDEAEKIQEQDHYIAVMGLSVDENGKTVGDRYPGNGFDGSIFDMRYKYRVRGDKFGIFLSKTYLDFIKEKDYSHYSGKGYIPQSVIFNDYDAKGLKTRFVNKTVRTYHKDENDAGSVSNTRWSGKNVFGLKEGHLSFLNSYGSKLFVYPKALLRNIIGYQFYSYKNRNWSTEMLTQIKNPAIKMIAALVIPFSFIYHKLK